MIESIIGIVFGLTILLTSIFTEAGTVVIVFGAILLAVSIGCLIMEILKKQTYVNAENRLIDRINSLEVQVTELKKTVIEKDAEIVGLKAQVTSSTNKENTTTVNNVSKKSKTKKIK